MTGAQPVLAWLGADDRVFALGFVPDWRDLDTCIRSRFAGMELSVGLVSVNQQ